MATDTHTHDHDHDHAHGGPAEGGAHATVGFYTFIAVVLCIVTAVEVAILYPPLDHMPDFLKIGILVILSLAKFAAVVAFFMHLYFDHPLTTALFLIGMVLATGTVISLIHVMPGPRGEPLKPLPPEKPHQQQTERHSQVPPEPWRHLQRG